MQNKYSITENDTKVTKISASQLNLLTALLAHVLIPLKHTKDCKYTSTESDYRFFFPQQWQTVDKYNYLTLWLQNKVSMHWYFSKTGVSTSRELQDKEFLSQKILVSSE